MNKKGILIVLVLVFALLMGGASLLYNSLKDKAEISQLSTEQNDNINGEHTSRQEEQVKDNKVKTLDFLVYDKDGKEVHLFDFVGKPIVLNFWASWCGPCQMEMPDFEEKYQEMGEEVQFLMINMTGGRETKESADAFLEEQGYTFPVFYDVDSDAASTYGAYSLPTSYFIDEEGYIVARATGMIDGETLAEAIRMIYNPDAR